MELIEKKSEFESRFSRWNGGEDLANYPFIENVYAPFTPARRSLPMLNLALISSAGAYIDGTESFDTETSGGDFSFKEIPVEIEAEDLKYAARGYDRSAVEKDMNVQIPIDRLREYEENAVIGRLNHVWWSLAGHIPNAAKVADELAPKLVERVVKSGVQSVLLIPASPLCHQTLGLIARAIEQENIPTMMLAVDRKMADKVRPPRTAFYDGEFGSVVGKPLAKEYQLRVLDESLRWIETLDQPVVRKLAVDLETEVEIARGER